MRPDFLFGLAIVLCGLAVMTYGGWSSKSNPHEFKTLAIWCADNGRGMIGMIQWFDGVVDRKYIESLPTNVMGLRLSEVITIDGKAVDPSSRLLVESN